MDNYHGRRDRTTRISRPIPESRQLLVRRRVIGDVTPVCEYSLGRIDRRAFRVVAAIFQPAKQFRESSRRSVKNAAKKNEHQRNVAKRRDRPPRHFPPRSNLPSREFRNFLFFSCGTKVYDKRSLRRSDRWNRVDYRPLAETSRDSILPRSLRDPSAIPSRILRGFFAMPSRYLGGKEARGSFAATRRRNSL